MKTFKVLFLAFVLLVIVAFAVSTQTIDTSAFAHSAKCAANYASDLQSLAYCIP
jgi:hypothetical protein